jgi:16S rRNA (cytidine1402-2'-O)-methyltransferase
MNHPVNPSMKQPAMEWNVDTDSGMASDGMVDKTATVNNATLYVVATPIGNLGDITLRALEVLKIADVIAAEDTRVTIRLLNRHGIAGKLVAVHEHNERHAAERMTALLAEGKTVALVSDAGTPGIADPGAQVVAAVRAAGYAVVPIPGPNAAAAVLSASGFEASRFLFCGFLPARAAERRRELADLAAQTALLVFYEAPHRVADSVADLCAAFGGERHIVIARELTKIHETLHRCRLDEAVTWLDADDNHRRGEFVLVVEGAAATEPSSSALDAEAVLTTLLAELPVKQAVALAVKLTGGNRNALYKLALALKGKSQDEA